MARKMIKNQRMIKDSEEIEYTKKACEITDNCFTHLKVEGSLTLVIRKDQGEESLKKHIEEVFGYCEILKRNKGFYILHSVKKN